MTMKRQLSICILLIVAGTCSLLAQTKSNTASISLGDVRIIPVTVYGDELQVNVSVEQFRSVTNGKNFAGHFHAGLGTAIPYDVYRAKLFIRGAYSTYRDIRVFGRGTIAVIAFVAGVEGGTESQTSTVSGSVNINRKDMKSQLRVRLSGVYSGTIIDAGVNDSREFSISSVPNGTYLISVSRANEVLHSSTIRVPSDQSTRFIINVTDNNP